MSRFICLLAATSYAAIHTAAYAQGPVPSSGGAPPVVVQAVSAKTLVVADANRDEGDAVADVPPSNFSVDLRVVSMSGPTVLTISTGAAQQVMLVTIANFGRVTATSANLFLDQDNHGTPIGSAKLALPKLAPGAKVSIPVPVTIAPQLQGQVCFTARLELQDTPAPPPLPATR